jgi:hypothetical protein
MKISATLERDREDLDNLGKENVKATLIHIPKTGGRTIRYLFKKRNDFKVLDHGTDSLLVLGKTDLIKKIWDDLGFVFAFCRNPYDRCISAFSHGCFNNRWESFEVFLTSKDGLEKALHSQIIVFRPMVMWLKDIPEPAIYRFELFEATLWHIIARFGFPIPDEIPKHNHHPHPPYKECYTQKTADIVYNFYEADFKRFNYERESWK